MAIVATIGVDSIPATTYWDEAAETAPRRWRNTCIVGMLVTILGAQTELQLFTGTKLQLAWSIRSILFLYFGINYLVSVRKPELVRAQFGWFLGSLVYAVGISMTAIGLLIVDSSNWYFIGIIEAELAAATFFLIPQRIFVPSIAIVNAGHVLLSAAVSSYPNPDDFGVIIVTMLVIAIMVSFAHRTIIQSSKKEFYRRSELARSEQQVATILQSITNAFFALDHNWKFTYFNHNAEWLLSRMQQSKESLLGRSIWNEFPNLEADSLMHEEFFRAVREKNPVQFEEYYPLMDVYLEVHAYPSESGISVYLTNVSDRKLAEDALKISHQELEQRVSQRTQELRDLLAHVESIREEEQSRISRDIHDQIGQLLSLLRMELSFLKKRTDLEEVVIERIQVIDRIVFDTIATARQIAGSLRPTMLDDLGLAAAVEWLLESTFDRADLNWQCDIRPDPLEVPANISTAVYRILQEALGNIVRHAQASQVVVALNVASGKVNLLVKDDGIGFTYAADGQDPRQSLGLINMRERTLKLGGVFNVDANPGTGVVIGAEIPYKPVEMENSL